VAPLPVPPAPMAVRNSSVSRSSRATADAFASSSAARTSASAAAYAVAGELAARGSASTAWRRARASGSVANLRARPTCPPLTDAAHVAVCPSSPSRSCNTRATAAAVGVRSATWRHRERSVTEMSSGSVDGAQSRNTVRCGGSSTTLSSAFAAPSVSRSASSTTTTCQRPVLGRRAAICTMARISETPMLNPSGTTRRTSPWVPASTVRHAVHCPHPRASGSVHCKAAARHTAATDRPDPGGPVNNHACVIAEPASAADGAPNAKAAAPRSTCSTSGWPTNRSKTLPTACTLRTPTDSCR